MQIINNFIRLYIIKFLNVDLKYFWYFVLFLSAYKNIIMHKFYLVHNPEYYHYPVFNFFSDIPKLFDVILLFICLCSLLLVFSKNTKYQAISFFINGISNFYFQASDLLALHHDTQVSSLIFFAYGIYLFLGKTNKSIKPLIAVTAITFLGSGLIKMSPDFLSGEIVSTLLQRPHGTFYYFIYEFFEPYSSLLAVYSMLLEIIEPIFLLFTTGLIKVFLIILGLPFHLGLLLSGTGTVYNTIYPVAFLTIIWHENFIENKSQSKLLKYIIVAFAQIFIVLIIFYCAIITLRFLNFQDLL